jgi:hypothetical protein
VTDVEGIHARDDRWIVNAMLLATDYTTVIVSL